MAGRRAGGGQESQGVEVALAPEELELDPMAMTQKYEEHVREQQAQVEKEDFSDMVAEHAAKQKVFHHRIQQGWATVSMWRATIISLHYVTPESILELHLHASANLRAERSERSLDFVIHCIVLYCNSEMKKQSVYM